MISYIYTITKETKVDKVKYLKAFPKKVKIDGELVFLNSKVVITPEGTITYSFYCNIDVKTFKQFRDYLGKLVCIEKLSCEYLKGDNIYLIPSNEHYSSKLNRLETEKVLHNPIRTKEKCACGGNKKDLFLRKAKDFDYGEINPTSMEELIDNFVQKFYSEEAFEKLAQVYRTNLYKYCYNTCGQDFNYFRTIFFKSYVQVYNYYYYNEVIGNLDQLPESLSVYTIDFFRTNINSYLPNYTKTQIEVSWNLLSEKDKEVLKGEKISTLLTEPMYGEEVFTKFPTFFYYYTKYFYENDNIII